MFKKVTNNIKKITDDITKTEKKIKIKKDNFNKESNKWGTKEARIHKIP